MWYSFYSTSRRRGKLSPTDLWLTPQECGPEKLIFHYLCIYLFNFYKLIENTVKTEKTLAAIQSSFHPLSIPKCVLLESSFGEAFLTIDIRNYITFLPPKIRARKLNKVMVLGIMQLKGIDFIVHYTKIN